MVLEYQNLFIVTPKKANAYYVIRTRSSFKTETSQCNKRKPFETL